MKRIYVAGASSEIGLVIEVMRSLREGGFEITYDWTDAVAKFGSAGAELSEEDRRAQANKAINGVLNADILWLLVPDRAVTFGAWIEYGAALAQRGQPTPSRSFYEGDSPFVIISCGAGCIFALLADKRFETHEAALAWLLGGMP